MANQWPVEQIEHHKYNWKYYSAPFLCSVGQFLFSKLGEECDSNKLKHGAVDKDYAHEHPDVQVGDIRDPRNVLSDTIEHGGEGKDGSHAHAHPARDRALWNKER